MKRNSKNITGYHTDAMMNLLRKSGMVIFFSLLLVMVLGGRLHAQNEVADPAAKDVNTFDSGGDFTEDDFSLGDAKGAKSADKKSADKKSADKKSAETQPDAASDNGSDDAIETGEVDTTEPPSNETAAKVNTQPAETPSADQVKGSLSPAVATDNKNSVALPAEPPPAAGEVPTGKPRKLDAVTSEYGPVVPRVLPSNEFGGVPLVPGTRRNVARDEAPEQYTVEPGDTLYDICDQLLDEPNYWPKLWSLNPQIKNPHFIYPGIQLAFYPGDSDSPPFLQLITEDEVVPIDKANLTEADLVREDISKLLTETGAPKATPVIGPNELSAEFQGPFEFWGKIYTAGSIDVEIPAFVFKEKKTPLATVVGSETGKYISQGKDRVIMRADQNLAPGSSYTILRLGQDIRSLTTNSYVGVRYDFIAHINVQDALEEGIYRGTITTDRLGIQPGDLVVPYISTKRKVPPGQLKITKNVEDGEVIAFAYPYCAIGGKALAAIFTQVDGQPFQEGDIVGVYHQLNRTISKFENKLPAHKKLVAIAYIISATDTASVGYVVDADREVSLGDTTGGGKGKL